MELHELEKELNRYGDIFIKKFEDYAEIQADKIFFYYGEEDCNYTYSEFNRLSNCFGRNLQSLGVKKGDRVSLFLFNPFVTAIAMFSIWKAGAVYCPINYNLKGKLLSYHINDVNPSALITEQRMVLSLNQVAKEIPSVQIILYQPQKEDHDYSKEAEGYKLDERFPCINFNDLLKGNSKNLVVPLSAGDTANIIYTSGTTGRPKGVVQAHRYLHNYLFVPTRFAHPDDVVYNDLPLYHVGGAFANVVRAGWAGCQVAVWDKFSPNEFWDRIRKCGATNVILLDVMITWLMMADETPMDRDNSLKMATLVPLPENHHEIARRFGIDFLVLGYGSSEAGSAFSGIIDEFGDDFGTPIEMYKGYSKENIRKMAEKFNMPILKGWEKIKEGVMGGPLVILDSAVLRENGELADIGEPGQAAFREKLPHLIFKEYFNKPDETAEVLKDGWYFSGDIIVRDEDGTYRFVDRKSGFIRSRGENISSNTVESLLNDHPSIRTSVVFPIPAIEGNEDDIVAFIILEKGEKLREDDLRSWLKENMPKYMRPKHIKFVDTFPTTPTFKVEKYKLKKLIMEELEL